MQTEMMLTGGPAVRDRSQEDRDLEPFSLAIPASTLYRRLRMCGLTEPQAGNLTARAAGLAAGGRPWRLVEVQRLEFLRVLVEQGRIGS